MARKRKPCLRTTKLNKALAAAFKPRKPRKAKARTKT